jgi:hypothetical protein
LFSQGDYGVTLPTNVPRSAYGVRVVLGMYSAASQIDPSEPATAAE